MFYKKQINRILTKFSPYEIKSEKQYSSNVWLNIYLILCIYRSEIKGIQFQKIK